MRIGFVIYGSLDTLTGGYLYDRIVVEGLRMLGHQVTVISLPSGSYLRRLWLGFSPSLLQRLLTGGFDLLIEDELCHPSLFLVNRRLHSKDGPILVTLVHHILSDEPRDRWRNRLLSLAERRFLATADAFIHNSETTRKKVASLLEHTCPEVVAYPAGDRLKTVLSPEAVSKRAHRSGPLRLLFLGNVIPRKGLLPLLQALAEIDPGIWRLSVVGGLDFDLAYTSKIQRLVRQLGSDSVRFLGSLQEAKLVEVLRNSQVFCMPYAYEGFGIAILEAMSFGLPAIGCLDGAAGETIRHGVNGFLLASDDLTGLAALLMRLHKDREELLRLGLAACKTYAAHPSWQDSVAAIDTFLATLPALQIREKSSPDKIDERT